MRLRARFLHRSGRLYWFVVTNGGTEHGWTVSVPVDTFWGQA